MTTKEMIKYLQRFDPETDIYYMALNPPARLRHEVNRIVCITDMERPVIALEIGGAMPLDEEETAAAEDCEAET